MTDKLFVATEGEHVVECICGDCGNSLEVLVYHEDYMEFIVTRSAPGREAKISLIVGPKGIEVLKSIFKDM